MKIVIIGGGIAGMAAGSFLHRNGMDVVICERQTESCPEGHAFLMHAEALSVLEELEAISGTASLGKNVNHFILRRPDGEEVRNETLDTWRCIRRSDLTGFLEDLLPQGTIVTGREFSHFKKVGNKVIAAVFLNGETEYGDVFIGADGSHSAVRERIFGKVRFTRVAVKEIVGMSRLPRLTTEYSDTFLKFQDKQKGLAFGVIPTNENEFVWFMQYDPRLAELEGNDSEDIRRFCQSMLRPFPSLVKEILQSTNFSGAYLWKTRDFDLLPSFHHKNIVLLGDAAHLTLPFTSAGTTNAIIGAKTLSDCLQEYGDLESAFAEYYRRRAATIEGHIALGRGLSKKFLFPSSENENGPLPFLSAAGHTRKQIPKTLDVLYFTDPICSTCWIFQPLLKKMNLEYGHYLNVEYHMGGLLPSWQDCEGKIKSPTDAAHHWNEIGELHEIPLDGDVWFEDPLSSSFPPSIVFKAAQIQDAEKAIHFLRRIREMVFLEKKNIMKWVFLETAALEVGLNPLRLLRDYANDATQAFEKDLALAKDLNVISFPTLILQDRSGQPGRSIILKGHQPYQKIEEAILLLLPSAKKEEIDRAPESLFANFRTMVDMEFALLSDLQKPEAIRVLQKLEDNGQIDRMVFKNGSLWKLRS